MYVCVYVYYQVLVQPPPAMETWKKATICMHTYTHTQVNSMFMDESDYMDRNIRDLVLNPPAPETWAGAVSDAIMSFMMCAVCTWCKARKEVKRRHKAESHAHSHGHSQG